MSARGHGTNHRLHEIEILQASGAAIAPHDFLYGATEVDVDELGLKDIGDERGSFAHRHGISAEDLYSDRSFVWPEPKLVQRRGVLASNAFR
jgi:hypothetical protein